MFPVSLSVCGRESLKEQLEPCRDDDATGIEAVFVSPENSVGIQPYATALCCQVLWVDCLMRFSVLASP